eukprot:6192638-Pleurochrysis_carterae.AAC.1
MRAEHAYTHSSPVSSIRLQPLSTSPAFKQYLSSTAQSPFQRLKDLHAICRPAPGGSHHGDADGDSEQLLLARLQGRRPSSRASTRAR